MVLAVDDERPVTTAFADHLGEGYAVTTVYSGEAALDATDATVDAVVLDRRLPDRHGDDVPSTLRETLVRHLAPADRGPRLTEFVGLAAKLAVLEEERPDRVLEDSDKYRRLRRRTRQLADGMEGEVDGFADAVTVRRVRKEGEE